MNRPNLMPLFALIAAAALAAAGCTLADVPGAGEGEPPGAARGKADDTDQAVLVGTGTYSVPIDDPALEELGSFSSYHVTWSALEGQVEVEYSMPALLTGVPQRVVMSGAEPADPQGAIHLSGPAGTGVCSTSPEAGGFECEMNLAGVAFDLPALRDNLEALGFPPAEVDGRLAVAERFLTDPIGTLSIDLGPDAAY